MNKTWADQYKDPRWQKKRLEIMGRDEWKCLNCESDDKMFSVHHQWYEKDKKLWEYPDVCYRTLCSECHEYEHHLISGFFPYFRQTFFENGWKIHEVESLLAVFSSKYSEALRKDVNKYWWKHVDDLTKTKEGKE